MPGHNYPVHAAADDPRFSLGLLWDVEQLLRASGYPAFTGQDHVRLRQALYRFLYTEDG